MERKLIINSKGEEKIVNPFKIEKEAPPPSRSFTENLATLQRIQEERKNFELWRDHIEIRIDTRGEKYFFVMPLSDVHLSAMGTDHNLVEKYLGAIKDYPIYTVLVGDLIDNFTPFTHPTGISEDLVNQDAQMVILRSMFEYLDDKILSVIVGNHDDWTKKTSGMEIYRWVAQDLGIPLLYSGGTIDFKINDLTYRGIFAHAISKFNSSFNPTHAGKRVLELYDDADFIVSGDKHRFGMEKLTHRGKKPYIVQLGTFKIDDEFGKRSHLRIPRPQEGFPILVFSAYGKKNIEAIEDLDTAIDIFYRR